MGLLTLLSSPPALREGRDHLEGQGSIQDKITVCATDDSYQTTRERMSQVEKDIWSRSAIEIKPGPSERLPSSLCLRVVLSSGLRARRDRVEITGVSAFPGSFRTAASRYFTPAIWRGSYLIIDLSAAL